MYRAVGDIWGDIGTAGGAIVGGLLNQGAPPPTTTPTTTKEPIYCPQQAALIATANATYPNDELKRNIFLLTHGPGFSQVGGWAGWCAIQAQAKAQAQPAPVDQGMHYAPPQTMPMTPAVGTTATPWTTYAAIGAGVLGLAGIVWYLKK